MLTRAAAKLHADKSDDFHQDVLSGCPYNFPYTLIGGMQMQHLSNRYGRNGCNMLSAALILAARLTLAVGNAAAFDKPIFRKR